MLWCPRSLPLVLPSKAGGTLLFSSLQVCLAPRSRRTPSHWQFYLACPATAPYLPIQCLNNDCSVRTIEYHLLTVFTIGDSSKREIVRTVALVGVAQRTESWPATWKVVSSFPGQGTCLVCGLVWGTREAVNRCFSPSLSLSLKLNKIFKKNCENCRWGAFWHWFLARYMLHNW